MEHGRQIRSGRSRGRHTNVFAQNKESICQSEIFHKSNTHILTQLASRSYNSIFPRNCIRNDLRKLKIPIFPGGQAPPNVVTLHMHFTTATGSTLTCFVMQRQQLPDQR